jgi:diguanylate cyclase (GGDEF)-like protein
MINGAGELRLQGDTRTSSDARRSPMRLPLELALVLPFAVLLLVVVLAAIAFVYHLHLRLASEVSQPVLLASTRDAVATSVLIFAAGILAFFAAFAHARRVLKDLKRLSSVAMRTAEDTSAPTTISIDRCDEIGELAKGFSIMQRLLRTDRLTGLRNRAALMRSIERRLDAYRNSGARCFAILFVDLDGMKSINDSLGHEAGDRLLMNVGRRLRACVRETDLVARLAGDEFVVLVDPVADRAGAERVRKHIEAALAEPMPDLPPYAGGSVGLALYPQDGLSTAVLLRAADEDMYRRKSIRHIATTPSGSREPPRAASVRKRPGPG